MIALVALRHWRALLAAALLVAVAIYHVTALGRAHDRGAAEAQAQLDALRVEARRREALSRDLAQRLADSERRIAHIRKERDDAARQDPHADRPALSRDGVRRLR